MLDSFSHSQSISLSVPVTFFGPRRLSGIRNDALGKRKRDQKGKRVFLYQPDRDLPLRKRRRFHPPDGCHCNWHSYPLTSSIQSPRDQPWHQNDRFVRQLPKAELAALVDPASPQTNPTLLRRLLYTNLKNPIHPLFRSLAGLSITLPYLATSLRLATKLLISPYTLPFFHTLITTSLTLLQAESHIFSAPVTWLPKSQFACPTGRGLPPAEYQLTMQTLLALTDHISIQISPDPRLAARWAYTERLTPPQHLTSGRPSEALEQHSSKRTDTSWSRDTSKPSSWHVRDLLPQLFPTPAHLHPPHPQPHCRTTPPLTNDVNHSRDPTLTDLDGRQQHLRTLNFRGTNALINVSPLFLRMVHPHFTHSPRPYPESQTRTGGHAGERQQETTHEAITEAQRERAIFFLAITLVHELAHAVFMTRFPVLSKRNTQTTSTAGLCNAEEEDAAAATEYEPFHSSQRSAELGHAWETTVFAGGKILSLAQDDCFGLGLGWMRWPGVDSFFVRDHNGGVRALSRLRPEEGSGEHARETGMARGRKSGSEGRILGPPKYETVYPLDWRYIRRFFLEGFWERVVHGVNTPSSTDLEVDMDTDINGTARGGHTQRALGMRMGMGVQAFTPPKTLGSRVRNHDWIDPRYSSGTLYPENENARGMEADDAGQDGYSSSCSSLTRGHDCQGVVRDGQLWVASEDEEEGEEGEDEY